MRTMIFVAAALGAGLPGVAVAQGAQNTPEGIVCAMTGSCDAPAADDQRVALPGEKAFSLALPSAPKPNAPARAAAPPARARAAAPARVARRVVPAKVHPDGGIDMLVTFPRGSSELTPQAQTEARAFAQAMAAPQMAGLRFAVEGHTDASGPRDRNMALSQARAQSVVDYLISQGVDASRLSAKGYGPDRPIPGTRPTAPSNRRVEFVKQS